MQQYQSCLTDMVPVGVLEPCGECDIGYRGKWTGQRFLKLRDEQGWDKRRGQRWLSEQKREFIEVGAYDELPGEVVHLPGKSEYLSYLPDIVPGGELGHGAECDKGVNVSNTQGGRLAGDVQNRDQRGGENTRPKKNSQLVRTKDCG